MTLDLQPQDERKFAIKVIILALIAFVIVLLSSCSCDWHLQRAEAKCGKLSSDTIMVHDTLFTKQLSKDTIFKYFVKDSVIVKEGKLVMKYYYNSHDSTVYLQGKCIADTIIREIKAPYEKTVIKVEYFPSWLKWVGCIIGVLFILLILYKKFVG